MKLRSNARIELLTLCELGASFGEFSRGHELSPLVEERLRCGLVCERGLGSRRTLVNSEGERGARKRYACSCQKSGSNVHQTFLFGRCTIRSSRRRCLQKVERSYAHHFRSSKRSFGGGLAVACGVAVGGEAIGCEGLVGVVGEGRLPPGLGVSALVDTGTPGAALDITVATGGDIPFATVGGATAGTPCVAIVSTGRGSA
jgi:hypothetical protein